MANHYDIPTWAGKPPVGTHLDVMKGDKLIQKLMLDEKKCYLFGRNPQMNDFCIDHQSCSRVHAAFVYHKHLQRAFLVDLGSTHGTFIGNVRLEANRPTQLNADCNFHFGASTRSYVMRQRPSNITGRHVIEQLEHEKDELGGATMLGLPQSEMELDNLTEFNTAHNRRISMLGIGEDGESGPRVQRRKRASVTFNEEEEVINPEDVDPSIGRFRNMVHTTVIPSKRHRLSIGPTSGLTPDEKLTINPLKQPLQNHNQLYSDITPSMTSLYSNSIASKLGIALPNPAPDVQPYLDQEQQQNQLLEQQQLEQQMADQQLIMDQQQMQQQQSLEPRKKKYAKEAWPGKKSGSSLLLV